MAHLSATLFANSQDVAEERVLPRSKLHAAEWEQFDFYFNCIRITPNSIGIDEHVKLTTIFVHAVSVVSVKLNH